MSENNLRDDMDQVDQRDSGVDPRLGEANQADENLYRSPEKSGTHQPAQTRIIEPSLPDFSADPNSGNLGMLMGVNLNLTVELGRTTMSVRQVLDLQKGAVVELDRIAGEAVDVYVNERLIARGDVVVVDDKFGVRITELVSPNPAG